MTHPHRLLDRSGIRERAERRWLELEASKLHIADRAELNDLRTLQELLNAGFSPTQAGGVIVARGIAETASATTQRLPLHPLATAATVAASDSSRSPARALANKSHASTSPSHVPQRQQDHNHYGEVATVPPAGKLC